MGPSEFDAEAKMAMMAIARRVVLVADATKFGRDSYVRVAQLNNVHDLVTDARVDRAWRERIAEVGVRLHIAGTA
jgi:DeoR/GlpR family transcriptional regulator of sugar metabolism